MGRRIGGWSAERLGRGMVAATVAASALAVPVTGQLPWDADAWRVEAAESRVEKHLGRPALYLRNGTAWLEGVSLRDGVIEFDLAAPASMGFHGVRLRAVDDANHEHVYLRPHLSGQEDATSYNPVVNGVSSWQIFADGRYQLPLVIPPDRWMRVHVSVRDRRMELAVDGGEPLVFPALVRDPAEGAVGLTASGAGVWFANVVVRPEADPVFTGSGGAQAPAVPEGVVSRWNVSEPFSESPVDGVTELPEAMRVGRSWTELEVEDNGIANLARAAVRTSETNTVFAALTLRSDGARTVPVEIGFSDRVRVFLNGRQLFRAGDEYASRDYRFLGTVGFWDTVFLPLEPGDNELWLAVSETFGGWAAALRMPSVPGVGVATPAQNR